MSTAVSSRFTATTIWRARPVSAWRRTSLRVPSPVTATSPAALASAAASAVVSMTTMACFCTPGYPGHRPV